MIKEEVIEKLRKSGFFDMNINEQKQFLREHGFFELGNQTKINFLESIGLFYLDINNDPPDIPLKPEEVDYLKRNELNAKKNRIANDWKENFTDIALKRGDLIIDGINGMENAVNVKTGAIVTVNHFNPFDTFAIERVLKDAGIQKRIYKVIREGNYTNFPGKFGAYFRNDNTLPLSRIPETMELFDEAVEEILQRGDFIIVCPEQSMWLNYRQPKPFKYGAFKWATLNNVPVIPTFITRRDSNKDPENSIQAYTINIGTPIYPDNTLTPRENIARMRNSAYSFCQKAYQEQYGVPIKYKTIEHSNLPQYVISTPNFKDLMSKDKGVTDDIEL